MYCPVVCTSVLTELSVVTQRYREGTVSILLMVRLIALRIFVQIQIEVAMLMKGETSKVLIKIMFTDPAKRMS